MSTEGKWLVNLNEDGDWSSFDNFETREKAIEYGKTNFEEMYEEETGDIFDPKRGDKVFYVGQIKKFKAYVCVDSILEKVAENAYDEVGEFAEGYLEKLTNEEVKLLETSVNEVFLKWMEETNNKPIFFKIENTEEIKF